MGRERMVRSIPRASGVVLAALVMILMLLGEAASPSPVSAQIAGATYNGTTSFGTNMSVTVYPDGKTMDVFVPGFFTQGNCFAQFADGHLRPVNISGNSFYASFPRGENTTTVRGNFPSPQQVQGTVSITHFAAPCTLTFFFKAGTNASGGGGAGQGLGDVVGIVKDIIFTTNEACDVAECQAYTNMAAVLGPIITFFERALTLFDLGKVLALTPQLGHDLDNLHAAIRTSGSKHSTEAKAAAHQLCLTDIEIYKALIDAVPLPGLSLVFPAPACK